MDVKDAEAVALLVVGGRHEQALPDPPGHHQQAGAVGPRCPARGETVEVGRRTELVEPADDGIHGNGSARDGLRATAAPGAARAGRRRLGAWPTAGRNGARKHTSPPGSTSPRIWKLRRPVWRSEEPTSELHSLMRISYHFLCLN